MPSTTPLNYASPGTHRESRKPTGVAVVLLIALTGIACYVALSIERLNSAAGGVLPKTEPGKWRFAASVEEFWREEQAWKTGDPSWKSRSLTPAERLMLQAEIASEDARMELHAFLQRWGFLQYLIVFSAIAMTLWTFRSPRPKVQRAAACLCIPALLVAGVLMLVRSYVGSLIE